MSYHNADQSPGNLSPIEILVPRQSFTLSKVHQVCMFCLYVVCAKAKRNQLTTLLLWKNNECMVSVVLMLGVSLVPVLPDAMKEMLIVLACEICDEKMGNDGGMSL